MAADTKRGAEERVRVIAGGRIVWCAIERLDGILTILPEDALAAQGLHVVTAADKAVLDACAKATDGDLRATINGSAPRWLKPLAAAELARREAAK